MLCARVMRGISSIESTDAPVAASSRIACGAPSGSAKPITTCARMQAIGGRHGADLQQDVGGIEDRVRARATVAPCAA